MVGRVIAFRWTLIGLQILLLLAFVYRIGCGDCFYSSEVKSAVQDFPPVLGLLISGLLAGSYLFVRTVLVTGDIALVTDPSLDAGEAELERRESVKSNMHHAVIFGVPAFIGGYLLAQYYAEGGRVFG